MQTPQTFIERRTAARVVANCGAELVANISILDTSANSTDDALVFFGQTTNLSTHGIAVVIPSVQVDERYCETDNRIRLSLDLPTGSASFEVNAVRCVALNRDDKGEGYLLGTRIIRTLQNEADFEAFVRTL